MVGLFPFSAGLVCALLQAREILLRERDGVAAGLGLRRLLLSRSAVLALLLGRPREHAADVAVVAVRVVPALPRSLAAAVALRALLAAAAVVRIRLANVIP